MQQTVRALACLVCVTFVASARAKIGETVPQLIQRFGKAYTLDTVEGGTKYKFRSANISVDVTLENGVSISETYLSDHPLNTAGEPPNDIVQGILRTNVPKAKWIQIEAAPFGANYAMRSSDSRYIATLNYSGQQEENVVWTLTVQRVKSNGGSITSSPLSTKTASTPSPSAPPPAPTAPSPAPPATSPISLATATPSDVPTAATWDYGESDDEMGRGVTKWAIVQSLNTVSFASPYEGEQRERLELRKSPKSGKDVILTIGRGQFTSSYVQNFVTVMFDNGELQKFVIGDSAEGSTDVLFIRHYDQFVHQLRRAKTLKIEANFYREGARVFEFDVHGLKGDW